MPFEVSPQLHGFIQNHFSKHGDFEWTEEFFLRAISSAHSKYDVYWAVLGLREVGSRRAVPKLKELISYPMRDVQSSAMLTIAHIARGAESAFYAEVLLSPQYRQKAYAMWAIRDAADERAIPAVTTYLKKNMRVIRKRISNPQSHHEDTLRLAREYLHQFSQGNESAREMLDSLAAEPSQVAVKNVGRLCGATPE